MTQYKKGPVSAYAEKLGGESMPRYYSLQIDYEHSKTPLLPVIFIRFTDDSDSISFSELTTTEAEKHLKKWSPPNEWPEVLKKKELKRIDEGGYEIYSSNGTYISFKYGKPVFLGLCSHCEGKRLYPALIVNMETDTAYSLPLTEKQMSELFGAPDEVKKTHEVYYR